jgi:hypothetical protein
MKLKNKMIGIFICMLLLATIPLAAGTSVEETDEQPTDLIGMTWVRGWIFNPKTVLGMVHARAIRLHYVEITGMETDLGIVRVRDVSFRDGVFLRFINVGPLGSMTYVIGLTYGGININN